MERRKRWKELKELILGKKYELSIVEASDPLMKELNKTYRKKARSTNVLSFSFSQTEGEIFINIPLARKEAIKAGIPVRQYADYLLIHSLLHLKGFEHGEAMQRRESEFMEKKYGKKYHNWN